jgi:hypothetical protein
MIRPNTAAWPKNDSAKVSRRILERAALSLERMENRLGPGPGDAAVMARSCQQGLAIDTTERWVRRAGHKKGFPSERGFRL